MNMRRLRCLAILLACWIIVLFPENVSAYPTAAEHNNLLHKILFEQGYSIYQSDEIKKSITAIDKASQLSIDQFGGKNEEDFDYLKSTETAGGVIRGLPWKFSDIDYSKSLPGKEKAISANTHHRYTHQGWGRTFDNSEVDKFLKKRRKVLTATVNSVFDFGAFANFTGGGEKCDSMCALVYYAHILGDYDGADNVNKITNFMIPLAGSSEGWDIISKLKENMAILFDDIKDDSKYTQYYNDMMNELNKIDDEASAIVRSGGPNSDNFSEYHQDAIETKDVLIKYVPELLKGEKFFAKVFYPNRTS